MIIQTITNYNYHSIVGISYHSGDIRILVTHMIIYHNNTITTIGDALDNRINDIHLYYLPWFWGWYLYTYGIYIYIYTYMVIYIHKHIYIYGIYINIYTYMVYIWCIYILVYIYMVYIHGIYIYIWINHTNNLLWGSRGPAALFGALVGAVATGTLSGRGARAGDGEIERKPWIYLRHLSNLI